jgi:hypothetical protein
MASAVAAAMAGNHRVQTPLRNLAITCTASPAPNDTAAALRHHARDPVRPRQLLKIIGLCRHAGVKTLP